MSSWTKKMPDFAGKKRPFKQEPTEKTEPLPHTLSPVSRAARDSLLFDSSFVLVFFINISLRPLRLCGFARGSCPDVFKDNPRPTQKPVLDKSLTLSCMVVMVKNTAMGRKHLLMSLTGSN
jgi:hypothetical protein